jgi:universal stress protein A
MGTFNTILVPTDYSENAGAALSVASRLAADCGAKLVVAHACGRGAVREAIQHGLLAPDDDDATVAAKVKASHEARLAEFVAPLGAGAPSVERVLLFGEPARAVVDYAREHGVDLIVMGRRGVTLADVMLGSVAEKAVRHAHCPVMIVKRSQA